MKTLATDTVFPATEEHGLNSPLWGLTKREYFAAQAMTVFCATTNGWPDNGDAEVIAKRAVVFADALIEELNKESK